MANEVNTPANAPWPMWNQGQKQTSCGNQTGPTRINQTWRRQITGAGYASPPIIDEFGNLFIYFSNGLYCLDAQGNVKGSYTTLLDSYCALGANNWIYVFGFYAVVALQWTGSQFVRQWQSAAQIGQNWAPLTIAPDGTIYVVCSNSSIPGTGGHGANDRLVALNPADGSEKWHYPTGGFNSSSAAIDQSGNVYFGSDDGFMYALDSQGNLRWKKPTGGRVSAAPAIDENGNIYWVVLKPPNPEVLLATAPTGTLLWQYPGQYSDIWNRSYQDLSSVAKASLGPGGTIYMPIQQEVHALTWDGSAPQPTVKWIRAVDENVAFDFQGHLTGDRPAFITVDDQNKIYVTTYNKNFLAYDANGATLWKVANLWVTPPVMGADGTLYLGMSDTVFALGPDSQLSAALQQLWNDLTASSQAVSNGVETYTLNEATISNPSVWQMIEAAIGAANVTLTCADNLRSETTTIGAGVIGVSTPVEGLSQIDGGEIRLVGTGEFGGQPDALFSFTFSQTGNDIQLAFRVEAPPSWKFSDTFPQFVGTLFDTLQLSHVVLSQTATTAQPADEWQFTSGVVLAGPLAPVASLVAGNDSDPKLLSGTIALGDEVPEASLQIGTRDVMPLAFPINLADGAFSLSATVSLTSGSVEPYSSMATQILLNSAMTIGGHAVPVIAEVAPTGGMVSFEGELPTPAPITLDNLDIWGGAEDMSVLIPPSMQSQSSIFTLEKVGLWVVSENRQAPVFMATLAAPSWQAIQPAGGGSDYPVTMTGVSLHYAALDPFKDGTRRLSSKLTGQIDAGFTTLDASAKRPRFTILCGSQELQDPVAVNQVLSTLVSHNVSLPAGLNELSFALAEMSALPDIGNYYFRLYSDDTWQISTCITDFAVTNLAMSVDRVHYAPDSEQFVVAVMLLGLVEVAGEEFGISAYNPKSGNNWVFRGPQTLPFQLPGITEMVAAFNADWANALPQAAVDLRQDYDFTSLMLEVTPQGNRLQAILSAPFGWAGWAVVAAPFALELSALNINLTCDADESVRGSVSGPFRVDEVPVYLATSLPFDASDFTFALDQEVYQAAAAKNQPMPLPSVRAIVALVNQSWAENLPADIAGLDKQISLEVFSVAVDETATLATIQMTAADHAAAWSVIGGPPQFALTNLEIDLAATHSSNQNSETGTIKGTLPAGINRLPMRTELQNDWSNFTVFVDTERASESDSLPTVSDYVTLFEPSWLEVLPLAVVNAGVPEIESFTLTTTVAAQTANAQLQSRVNWIPVAGNITVEFDSVTLNLNSVQPSSSDNPTGQLRASTVLLGETVELTQTLPNAYLTGAIAGQVSLPDFVKYFVSPNASVPDYLQDVQIGHLVARLDIATNKLTITGVVAGDITVPREDDENELDECEYNQPQDSYIKNGRVTGSYVSHGQAVVCLAGDYVWNSGVEVPGQLCYPFTQFEVSIGSVAFGFPPAVSPAANPTQPSLDSATQTAQGLMNDGLSQAAAIFTMSQAEGLSPTTAIQTLFQLNGGDVHKLDAVCVSFTDSFIEYGCDPDETAEEEAEALENMPDGPVSVSATEMAVGLVAAFPGITAAALAEALLAAGFPPPDVPGIQNLPCQEVAQYLATDGYEPVDAARFLQGLSRCEDETGTAEAMTELLSSVYPSLTLEALAAALAGAGFAAADVAVALMGFAAATGATLTASALAALLTAAFGSALTAAGMASALMAAGFTAVEVAPILCGMAPLTAAALAALLIGAFGSSLSCSDLADALSVNDFDLISVTGTLKDVALCDDQTATAAGMADLLVAAYGLTLTCESLAEALADAGYSVQEVAPVVAQQAPALCTDTPQTAQSLADLLNSVYTNPPLSNDELAAALVLVGFSTAAIALVLASQDDDDGEPSTAEETATTLENTSPEPLSCSELAAALAGANYSASSVAPILKGYDACAAQVATADGMVSLLLSVYASISCQELANALAAASYDVVDTAAAIRLSSPCNQAIGSAGQLAAIVVAAYPSPPLTCQQLADALAAGSFSPSQTAPVLIQYSSLCGNDTQTAFGMTAILRRAYPDNELSCADLASILASAGYDVQAVASVITREPVVCVYAPASADALASTLLPLYTNPPLTCEQLAGALAVSGFPPASVAQTLKQPPPGYQTLCSQETGSAQAFTELLVNAYRFNPLSPQEMATALAAVGYNASELAPALKAYYPQLQTVGAMATLLAATYGDLTCAQLAAALAAADFDVTPVALTLQDNAQLCGNQTATASQMASLLEAAYGTALTCLQLAQALAACAYSPTDVAVVVQQQSPALCSPLPQTAGALANLLVSAYTNPPLTCVQLTQALAQAGYAAAQVAVVITQQPPLVAGQPVTATELASLLASVYTSPALTCSDLAAALAAAGYAVTATAGVLKNNANCADQTATADGMAALLLSAYPSLDCQQLAQALAQSGYSPTDTATILMQPPSPHQTLCSGQTGTAASLASLLETAYLGIGISAGQLASALAAAGFPPPQVAPVVRQLHPSATEMAYAMAAILLSVYPSLSCASLADSLAAAGYDADETASVLRQPPADSQVCASQVATAGGMAGLLLAAYPTLTCQQLADALAAAQYSPSDTATALQQNPVLCGAQTTTATAMAELLTTAYSTLSCAQLAQVLAACAYSPTDVAAVLKQQGVCIGETSTASGMATLLLNAYGNLTCTQLADALAPLYDPSSVAVVLKNPPSPYAGICASQTATAAGMTEILEAAYGEGLTEEQLEEALEAVGYPESQIQNVIETLYGGGTDGWPMYLNNVRHTGRAGQTGPATKTSSNTATKSLDYAFNGIAVDSASNVYVAAEYSPASYTRLFVLDSGLNQKGTYDDTNYAIAGLTPGVDVSGQFYMTTQWVRALYWSGNTIAQKWQYPTGSTNLMVTSPLVIGDDGTVYAVFTEISGTSCMLVALNPANGSVLWSVSINTASWMSSPVITSDGTVYFGCSDGNIYRRASDGTLTSRTLGPGYPTDRQPVIPAIRADGVLYVLFEGAVAQSGQSTGQLTALHPDLTPLWQNPYTGNGSVNGTASLALAPNGNIYAGFYTLQAITPEGKLAWDSRVGMYAAGIAVDASGNVFFGSGSYRNGFFAFDPNGNRLWTDSNACGKTAPAIGPDGSLYYSDGYGTLIKVMK